MNRFLHYDLAFVAPKQQPPTAPEIVFIVAESKLEEITERLLHLIQNCSEETATYLGNECIDFSLPIPDLFGNRRFGFAQCGKWETRDGKLYLRVQLGPSPQTRYCSLTIRWLTSILNSLEATEEEKEPGVRLTVLSSREQSHGHAVSGYLSGYITSWLKAYAKDKLEERGSTKLAPMHPEVITVMQSVWPAICLEGHEEYGDDFDIRGRIQENGAFSLLCFGDSCDLSVYWDDVGIGSRGYSKIDCHNLDTAEQQLTLLAGLAKLCQLAKESS